VNGIYKHRGKKYNNYIYITAIWGFVYFLVYLRTFCQIFSVYAALNVRMIGFMMCKLLRHNRSLRTVRYYPRFWMRYVMKPLRTSDRITSR
jgi:hypothetical protein